jgi:hypothetical protein
MYCSHCYRRGQFVMPAITVHGLEKRVKARLVEVGTPRLLAARLTQDFLSEKVEERLMRRVTLGVLLALVIGAADVGLMLTLSFPDKRAACWARSKQAQIDQREFWRVDLRRSHRFCETAAPVGSNPLDSRGSPRSEPLILSTSNSVGLSRFHSFINFDRVCPDRQCPGSR